MSGSAVEERNPDTAILAVALALATALLATVKIVGYDFWWHLSTGRWIWENRAIPRVNELTAGADGVPWLDHGWLFQSGIFGIHQGAGFAGCSLLIPLTVGLTVTILWRYLRRTGSGAEETTLLLLLCMWGARPRFLCRPDLVSLPLLVWTLVALRSAREGRLGALATLPPLFAVWANIHPGVVLGSLLVVLQLGTAAGVEWLRGGRGTRVLQPKTALLAGLTLAAPLANPSGAAIYGVPFQLGGLIDEAFFVNPEWLPPSWPMQASFFACLLLAAVLALRARRGLHPADWLTLVGLATIALRSQRFVAVFCLAMPVLLSPVRLLPQAGGESRRRAVLIAALVVAGALPALHGAEALPPGVGYDERRYPVGAADYVLDRDLQGALFNDIGSGGYLGWRLLPSGRKPLLDGRNEVHEELMRTMFTAQMEAREWRRFLAENGIEIAVLRYDRPPVTLSGTDSAGRAVERERPLSVILFPPPEWSVVFWDDAAMVVIRADGRNRSWAAREGLRLFHPDDWRERFREVAEGRLDGRAMLTEIEAALVADPAGRRARYYAEILTAILEAMAEESAGDTLR